MTNQSFNARLDRAAERAKAVDRVIAKIDEREKSCAGGFTDNRKVTSEYPVSMSAAKSVKYPAQQAPTEAERAVDKYWAKYLPEIAKLQRPVDGIAVKESK